MKLGQICAQLNIHSSLKHGCSDVGLIRYVIVVAWDPHVLACSVVDYYITKAKQKVLYFFSNSALFFSR